MDKNINYNWVLLFMRAVNSVMALVSVVYEALGDNLCSIS